MPQEIANVIRFIESVDPKKKTEEAQSDVETSLGGIPFFIYGNRDARGKQIN